MTPRRIFTAEIIAAVAAAHGVTPAEVTRRTRTAAVVRARQVAMYLARTLAPHPSFPEIGRRFGGYDHTTVMHAVDRIRRLAASDPAVAAELDVLRLRLTADATCHADGPVPDCRLPIADCLASPEGAPR